MTLTSLMLLIRSYSKTTKRSIAVKQLSETSDSSRNAAVTAGKLFQVSHAVFFAFPANDDVVSQPEMAWKTGRAEHLSGPKDAAIS